MRNFQASNNMKAMKIGDRVFFYHSNEGLAVVGIAEVAKTYYPDPTDESQPLRHGGHQAADALQDTGRPWSTSRKSRS